MRVGRDQIMRELFFWLRPDFILRCVRRFQKLEGFDRAVALASSTFTAMIPLAILMGAILPSRDAADSVISRYRLTDEGAQAVRDAFSPAEGVETGIGVLGGLLLLFAVLSFARAVQRLVERAFELRPLSLRNTRNAIVWVFGLVVYVLSSSGRAALLDRPLLGALAALALGAFFMLWTGRQLSAGRVGSGDLLPFAILVALGLGVYGLVSDAWVPELFDTYAARYGVIGATFAIISALFGATLVMVVMTAIGREVTDEIARARRGERPAPDAVRREWDALLDDLRARREVWLETRRSRKAAVAAEEAAAGDGERAQD
jgi:membrane protein